MNDKTETYIDILDHWRGEEFNNIDVVAAHVDRELKELKPLCDEMREADRKKRDRLVNSLLFSDFRKIMQEERRLAMALSNYVSTAGIKGVKARFGCKWLWTDEWEGVLL